MTAPGNPMQNSGLLSQLFLTNTGTDKVPRVTTEFQSSQLVSISKNFVISTAQMISTFSVEEMLRRGLCSEDLRESAWNISETTTIPRCLPLRLWGAELS